MLQLSFLRFFFQSLSSRDRSYDFDRCNTGLYSVAGYNDLDPRGTYVRSQALMTKSRFAANRVLDKQPVM